MNKIKNTTRETIRQARMETNYTMASAKKEEAEINSLRCDVVALDSELSSAFTQIGKKYFEYAVKNDDIISELGIDDIMRYANQKRERKLELENEILIIEKRLKDQIILQEKAKIQSEIDAQTEKLEQAKAMGIISDEEYFEKINKIRKRLDNFEAIRNVEKQYELGIITYSEKTSKLADLS